MRILSVYQLGTRERLYSDIEKTIMWLGGSIRKLEDSEVRQYSYPQLSQLSQFYATIIGHTPYDVLFVERNSNDILEEIKKKIGNKKAKQDVKKKGKELRIDPVTATMVVAFEMGIEIKTRRYATPLMIEFPNRENAGQFLDYLSKTEIYGFPASAIMPVWEEKDDGKFVLVEGDYES